MENLIIEEAIIMRIIFATLWRTLVLLACSIVQVFVVLFRCISGMFGGIGKFLNGVSKWMLECLDKGKYEAEMKAIVK
jgi:hypothetical protein